MESNFVLSTMNGKGERAVWREPLFPPSTVQRWDLKLSPINVCLPSGSLTFWNMCRDTDILPKEMSVESYKICELILAVPTEQECSHEEYTTDNHLPPSIRRRSGIIRMKKRYRRIRLLLTVLLLSKLSFGNGPNCDHVEARELYPALMTAYSESNTSTLGLDFQIEHTDFLEERASAQIVCGCYWFQDGKDCFTSPGYICNSSSAFIQLQIPQVSRQHAGKYHFRVLKGVHMTQTCILTIEELNVTTPEKKLNDLRLNTTLTPNPAESGGVNKKIIIAAGCVVSLALLLIGIFLFYKREKKYVHTSSYTSNPPPRDNHEVVIDDEQSDVNTETHVMLNQCTRQSSPRA